MIKRLSFFVSGNPQWEGFADTAISIGNELGLKGYAQNFEDGRVYIVAESEENTLWLFENCLELQNRYRFTEPTYQFDYFGKLMGEADEKMEEIKSHLKELIEQNHILFK
jgi:acylphosphatase